MSCSEAATHSSSRTKKGKIPMIMIKGFMSQNSLLTGYLPFRYKIYATLDLNKSLEEFKENVTKILELTDVENWDGVKIKNKESCNKEYCSNFSRTMYSDSII